MRHAPYSTFTPAMPFTAAAAQPATSAARAAWAKVLWLLGLPRRVAAIRRDMALLADMSARDLADIGLDRQDLRDAAALPLGNSPGPLFACRAAERQRARIASRR